MTQDELTVEVASDKHLIYVDEILKTIEEAAKVRGTGIAKRKPEYVAQKIKEAKAVIALQGEKFAGFSYIETWEHKQYVTTSGLIVHPDFRGLGLAKRIKDLTFSLARTRWPHAKIFSLTSGAAVMTMNTQLGYKPVTFAELTSDEAFWKGCEGCVNVDVLKRTDRKYCICTGMLFDPEEHLPAKIPQEVLERIRRIDEAENEADLAQLREELTQTGVLSHRQQRNMRRQKPARSVPYEYRTSDGFSVWAGKNNLQNDLLSMKTAFKSDIWFHTQKIHGSHVILVTDGREPTDTAMTEAAMIAAYHSKARTSAGVPVDYTEVRNLKKPAGAKPGFVIYHVYKTAFVTPDETLIESLRVK